MDRLSMHSFHSFIMKAEHYVDSEINNLNELRHFKPLSSHVKA